MKFQESFDYTVGLATIVGCIFSMGGVLLAWQVSRKAQEIVREVHRHYRETVVKHPCDTVYIRVPKPITMAPRDTVILQPYLIFDPDLFKALSTSTQKELDIRFKEWWFRNRHPETFK